MDKIKIITWITVLSLTYGSGALADTVVMKNGDAVSGSGCSVVEGKVSLTSDYAETVKIDLGAVEKITFDRPALLVLTDGTEKEINEYSPAGADLNQLKAINPPAPKVWSVDASAGYALSRGNSDTQDVNLQATVVYFQPESYRLTGHGEYAWGEVKDKDTKEEQKTTDRGLLSLQGDLFMIESGYLYARSEISYDKIKEIDRRLDNGLGLGYEIYRSDSAFLDFEFGGAYIDTKYSDGSKDHGIFLRLAENGELKINDRLTLTEKAEYKPNSDDFNDYLLNGEIGLKVSLSSVLYLQLSVVDRYDSIPAAGTEKNDISIISSLGFSI